MFRFLCLFLIGSMSIYCTAGSLLSSQENVEIESVKRCLGHSDESATLSFTQSQEIQLKLPNWSNRRLFSSLCMYLLAVTANGDSKEQLTVTANGDNKGQLVYFQNGGLMQFQAVPPPGKSINFCDYGYPFKSDQRQYSNQWVFEEIDPIWRNGVGYKVLSIYNIPAARISLESGFYLLQAKNMVDNPTFVNRYQYYTYGGSEVVIPLAYHVFSTPECEDEGFKYRILETTPQIIDSGNVACRQIRSDYEVEDMNSTSLGKLWYKTRETERQVTFTWTHQCVEKTKKGNIKHSVDPGPRLESCKIEAKHYGFCVSEQNVKAKQIVTLFCNDKKLEEFVLEDREFGISSWMTPPYTGSPYINLDYRGNEPVVNYAEPGKESTFLNNFECLRIRDGWIQACNPDGTLNGAFHHPPCANGLEMQRRLPNSTMDAIGEVVGKWLKR